MTLFQIKMLETYINIIGHALFHERMQVVYIYIAYILLRLFLFSKRNYAIEPKEISKTAYLPMLGFGLFYLVKFLGVYLVRLDKLGMTLIYGIVFFILLFFIYSLIHTANQLIVNLKNKDFCLAYKTISLHSKNVMKRKKILYGIEMSFISAIVYLFFINF